MFLKIKKYFLISQNIAHTRQNPFNYRAVAKIIIINNNKAN